MEGGAYISIMMKMTMMAGMSGSRKVNGVATVLLMLTRRVPR